MSASRLKVPDDVYRRVLVFSRNGAVKRERDQYMEDKENQMGLLP